MEPTWPPTFSNLSCIKTFKMPGDISLPYLTPLKKVARTRLPSVGLQSWSRFSAVSLQVTWVEAVGCHYFPPGLQLPRNPEDGCYQFRCLVNRGTMGVSSLPKTVTRQRRDCDLNPGPSAPESSTLTTRLPSHTLTPVLTGNLTGSPQTADEVLSCCLMRPLPGWCDLQQTADE